MESITGPSNVIWDITYACPLRCTHCYSESGRRPTRQLGRDDLLRVADAIIALGPSTVALAGGEPLLVKGIFDVAERIARSNIHVVLYTGGWSLRPEMVDDVIRVCDSVTVSVDGATPNVHDRVRGRPGSFDRAMRALALLDEASNGNSATEFNFGIDCVVVRSNFDQMENFCTTIAPEFSGLSQLAFGAVVPAGLASRIGFDESELLTETQLDQMGSIEWGQHLRSLAPPSVGVECTDNLHLQMNPHRPQEQTDFAALQVEPDGAVRAMPVYEGTIGNVLTEPGSLLWRRATDRWRDPFLAEALAGVRTMQDWAAATRRIDYHFGSEQVRARIDRRAAFSISTTTPGD